MWWLQILVTVVICVCARYKNRYTPYLNLHLNRFHFIDLKYNFQTYSDFKRSKVMLFNLPTTVNLLENIKAYWNPLIVSNFNIPSRWHPCLWNSWQMSPSPPLISLVVEISQVFCCYRRCLQNTQGVRHPPPILIFPNLIPITHIVKFITYILEARAQLLL